MIILSLIFFTVKAVIWFVLLGVLVAAIRLFILGPQQKYGEPFTDTSLLKKGDIILTGKTSTRYMWFIQLSNVMTRKIKHRFWIHAAIYRGDGLLWEAQPEGIVENNINEYLKNGFMVRVVRHKYISSDATVDKVLKFCEEQKGYRYGWEGLAFYVLSTLTPISFNFLFDNKWVDKICNLDKAYFCSELIVDAFYVAGCSISPYDGWRVKPTDFISNPVLEEVKGK